MTQLSSHYSHNLIQFYQQKMQKKIANAWSEAVVIQYWGDIDRKRSYRT